jgi:4-amino-4-deoxy-L-arabinose transferase-like glycosyltransferase
MLEMLKKNKEIFVICVLYAIISLGLFFLVFGGNAVISNDTPSYIMPAKHIVSNAFFSGNGTTAEYSRTPGYPLFLAIVLMLGGNNITVVIIQIILMVIKVYLFYSILIILHTPKKLSFLGSLLLLCNVQSYGYSFAIITEPLFGFLLVLSLYFLIYYIYKKKDSWIYLLFSISLNYALLVRPILMYFNMLVCLAMLIAFIIKKIQLKCFILFTLCFAIFFGGWSYRNYLHSGVFIFSTLPKNNTQIYYAPIITAGSEYMKTHDVQSFIEGATDYHEEMFLQEYPEVKDGNLNEAQIAVLRGKYGSQFIRNHFSEYIMVNITGFIKMMFTSFQTPLLFKSTTLSAKAMLIKIVQLIYLVYIIIIYVVYLIGLGIVFKKRDFLQIGIFLLCSYLAIPGAIFATVRFRDPFLPLLLLSAISNSGVIIQWLSQKLRIPALYRIEKYLLHETETSSND